MFNKFIIYVLSKFFMKYLIQITPSVNYISPTVYNEIEKKVGHIRYSGIQDNEYAYQLGQQSVLKEIRHDWVR